MVTVHRDISGSHCVVSFNKENYIDARRAYMGRGGSDLTNLEHVKDGFVRRRDTVRDQRAPEVILEWMREELALQNSR